MKYKVMCESPNVPRAILKPTIDSPSVPKSILEPRIVYNSPDVPKDVLKTTKKGK